jgi:hypothetical protein
LASGTTGAFGTARITFFTHLARITGRQSTDVGERVFKTLLARFCSGQVLKITRIAIQTIDSTLSIHVSTCSAIQTSVIARCILMLSNATFFTGIFLGHSFFFGIFPGRTSIATQRI